MFDFNNRVLYEVNRVELTHLKSMTDPSLSRNKVRSGGQRSQPVIDRSADQSEAAAFVSAAVIGWLQCGPAPIRSVSYSKAAVLQNVRKTAVWT